MQLLSAKDEVNGRKNTNRPPTLYTGPHQGKPRHPMPAYLINISRHMGVAATRVGIATPRQSDTITIPQWRTVWKGATIDARNDGVRQY